MKKFQKKIYFPSNYWKINLKQKEFFTDIWFYKYLLGILQNIHLVAPHTLHIVIVDIDSSHFAYIIKKLEYNIMGWLKLQGFFKLYNKI